MEFNCFVKRTILLEVIFCCAFPTSCIFDVVEFLREGNYFFHTLPGHRSHFHYTTWLTHWSGARNCLVVCHTFSWGGNFVSATPSKKRLIEATANLPELDSRKMKIKFTLLPCLWIVCSVVQLIDTMQREGSSSFPLHTLCGKLFPRFVDTRNLKIQIVGVLGCPGSISSNFNCRLSKLCAKSNDGFECTPEGTDIIRFHIIWKHVSCSYPRSKSPLHYETCDLVSFRIVCCCLVFGIRVRTS